MASERLSAEERIAIRKMANNQGLVDSEDAIELLDSLDSAEARVAKLEARAEAAEGLLREMAGTAQTFIYASRHVEPEDANAWYVVADQLQALVDRAKEVTPDGK